VGVGDVLASTPWAIERDTGKGVPEDVLIPDLAAFLAIAELTEHQELLNGEGIIVDDIPGVADELLVELGITKKMQRKRFLRYAKQLHVLKQEASADEPAGPHPWVIKMDVGKGPTMMEQVFLPDLIAFLELADLKEQFELLDENGVHIDDVTQMTSERLAEIGMSKHMHRKRFLRYAAQMHRQDPEQEAAEAAEAAAKKKERMKKTADRKQKELMEIGSRSKHDFAAKCTDYGRRLGACK
jgi:hypothetical protein